MDVRSSSCCLRHPEETWKPPPRDKDPFFSPLPTDLEGRGGVCVCGGAAGSGGMRGMHETPALSQLFDTTNTTTSLLSAPLDYSSSRRNKTTHETDASQETRSGGEISAS